MQWNRNKLLLTLSGSMNIFWNSGETVVGLHRKRRNCFLNRD